jgi:hypothetical protein
MERALIFLDIDGVLNSTDWCNRRPLQGLLPPTSAAQAILEERLDPTSIGYLHELVLATGARIVISSSWRLRMSVAELQSLFEHYGVARTALIGGTPQLIAEPDSLRRVIRGDEVARWRQDHHETIPAYLCLDDDADYHPDQPLVRTNPDYGLRPCDVAAGAKILRGLSAPVHGPSGRSSLSD